MAMNVINVTKFVFMFLLIVALLMNTPELISLLKSVFMSIIWLLDAGFNTMAGLFKSIIRKI